MSSKASIPITAFLCPSHGSPRLSVDIISHERAIETQAVEAYQITDNVILTA